MKRILHVIAIALLMLFAYCIGQADWKETLDAKQQAQNTGIRAVWERVKGQNGYLQWPNKDSPFAYFRTYNSGENKVTTVGDDYLIIHPSVGSVYYTFHFNQIYLIREK